MESGCLALVVLGIAVGALITAINASSASTKLREELRQLHERLDALERQLHRRRGLETVEEALPDADTLEKPVAPPPETVITVERPLPPPPEPPPAACPPPAPPAPTPSRPSDWENR